jgi:hypothetical protein
MINTLSYKDLHTNINKKDDLRESLISCCSFKETIAFSRGSIWSPVIPVSVPNSPTLSISSYFSLWVDPGGVNPCFSDGLLLFDPNNDDDVSLEYYIGKGFHINCSVYMSYVKQINSSDKVSVNPPGVNPCFSDGLLLFDPDKYTYICIHKGSSIDQPMHIGICIYTID